MLKLSNKTIKRILRRLIMDENKAILEALSELECILFYSGSGNDLQPEINELHDEAKAMIERWHFLTGVTL